MGMLIGEYKDSIVTICGLKVLTRSDKTQDRVEVSPEQLASVAIYAEELSNTLGLNLSVIGWYHSHPRITVHPSHVDLRSQSQYQMLDKSFIGLIFSVFNTNKITKLNTTKITCFQSTDSGEELRVPLYINEVPLASESSFALSSIPASLVEEELYTYEKAMANADHNPLTNIHNKLEFNKATTRIFNFISIPLMNQLNAEYENGVAELTRLHEVSSILKRRLSNQEIMANYD